MSVDELIAHLSALPAAMREMPVECPVWCSCYGHEPLTHIGFDENVEEHCRYGRKHLVVLLNPPDNAEPIKEPDLRDLVGHQARHRRGRNRALLQGILTEIDERDAA